MPKFPEEVIEDIINNRPFEMLWPKGQITIILIMRRHVSSLCAGFHQPLRPIRWSGRGSSRLDRTKSTSKRPTPEKLTATCGGERWRRSVSRRCPGGSRRVVS
jgi:hypothetical protein